MSETHVSLDLETLGTSSDAPILSVGAVKFDLKTGELGDTYYRRVSLESALKNRNLEADTLKWWMKQPEEARLEIVKNGRSMPNMLVELQEFITGPSRNMKYVYPWGNGATFDISILESAYRQYDLTIPWKFWNVRDLRTIVAVAEELAFFDKSAIVRKGVHHNALDDAIHQANLTCAAYNDIFSFGRG